MEFQFSLPPLILNLNNLYSNSPGKRQGDGFSYNRNNSAMSDFENVHQVVMGSHYPHLQ